MALKGILIGLCWLAVGSSSAVQDESLPQNCSMKHDDLTATLKVAVECGENLQLCGEHTAALLLSLRNLTDILHKRQLKDCRGAKPRKCPEAEVPSNGGLACVTVDNKRYCKPLCNHGYDFAFVRRSRPYDECNEQTGYRWNTKYIGGKTLAVCNEAINPISGAKTAYFPKDQDCLTTKSNSQLQNHTMENLKTELQNAGVQGQLQQACLVCG